MKAAISWLFLAGIFLPHALPGQARCTKNNYQWSAFLDGGDSHVQVRCRCAGVDDLGGQWLIQFRSIFDSAARVTYMLRTPSESYASDSSLALARRAVTREFSTGLGGCGSGVLDLFVTISARKLIVALKTTNQEAPRYVTTSSILSDPLTSEGTSPGEGQMFELIDLNGDDLKIGDAVQLRSLVRDNRFARVSVSGSQSSLVLSPRGDELATYAVRPSPRGGSRIQLEALGGKVVTAIPGAPLTLSDATSPFSIFELVVLSKP